jgi:hypothetical protein
VALIASEIPSTPDCSNNTKIALGHGPKHHVEHIRSW